MISGSIQKKVISSNGHGAVADTERNMLQGTKKQRPVRSPGLIKMGKNFLGCSIV
jgi:hypothetical protein